MVGGPPEFLLLSLMVMFLVSGACSQVPRL